MKNDFKYVFEKPTYVVALEKQQRILNEVMKPYKDLSGAYAGMSAFIKSVQFQKEISGMNEVLNTYARMAAIFKTPADEMRKSIESTFSTSYTDWKSTFAQYNDIMSMHQEAYQAIKKAFAVNNWDSTLKMQRTWEMLIKNHASYSQACTTLTSAIVTAFPDEIIEFDDVEFDFGQDGSITVKGRTYSEAEIPLAVDQQVKDVKEWEIADIPKTIDEFKRNYALLISVVKLFFGIIGLLVTIKEGCEIAETFTQYIETQMNGWDNLYFISNENGAAIYQDPSTDSPILMRATYSNAVRKTEDSKFWVKVQYPNVESEEGYVEGWIAKRNLIPYADVEFYGDDAVCDN